ncbi:MAG: hypothetical protein V1900_02590 [Candidatus Aenigmatarchaeota archaeon]
MIATVAKTPIGVFAFSEKGELLYYKLFSRDAAKAVDEFLSPAENHITEMKGYEIKEDRSGRLIRKKMREYAIDLGFVKNDSELNVFLSGFALILSKKRMKIIIGRDRLVVQASNALDDLNKIHNLLLERLREWYSLHYPESRPDIEKIIKYGRRENFPDFQESTGIEINGNDERILKDYALMIKDVSEKKNEIERYVKESMKEITPNVSSLLEPLLAARLLALAGSLERLAKMPSSTIQLLGAEKALFRHLKKQGRSPKYGLIFMDSHIQNARNENKGKIARLLAAKLMQAAKIDFYSGRYEEKLKKELEEEIKAVK